MLGNRPLSSYIFTSPDDEVMKWFDVRASYIIDDEDEYTDDFHVHCYENEIEDALIEDIQNESSYPHEIRIINFEIL